MESYMQEHYEVIWAFTEVLGILQIVINDEYSDMDIFDAELVDVLFNRV